MCHFIDDVLVKSTDMTQMSIHNVFCLDVAKNATHFFCIFIMTRKKDNNMHVSMDHVNVIIGV
jgi:hypothetical protein